MLRASRLQSTRSHGMSHMTACRMCGMCGIVSHMSRLIRVFLDNRSTDLCIICVSSVYHLCIIYVIRVPRYPSLYWVKWWRAQATAFLLRPNKAGTTQGSLRVKPSRRTVFNSLLGHLGHLYSFGLYSHFRMLSRQTNLQSHPSNMRGKVW